MNISRPRLVPLVLALIAAVPVPYFVSTVTNSAHNLSLVNPHIDTSAGFAQLQYAWGPSVWTYLVVSYTFLTIATIFLYLKFRRSRNVYQKISFFLTVTFLMLWAGNIVTFAGFSPLPHMMLVPYVFLLVGVLSILGFSTVKLAYLIPIDKIMAKISSGDVTPLARDFIVQEIESGVIVLDKDNRIVDINKLGKKMIGEEERVVGKKIHEAVNVSRVLDNYEEGDEIGELRDEIWVDTPNGERCYDISVSNISDGSDGEIAGRVILIHDITRQKERETELREREHELQQQKKSLEQQKNKLEHQNERLDKFASIVSHDLRNPLNIAEGYVDMLEDEVDTGSSDYDYDMDDEIGKVKKSYDRMENIIDDALTLARQGKAITRTQNVRLAEVVDEAWGNVETMDATLEIDVDDEVFVECDHGRLLNILENLFRNSVEHNDGTITVRVGMHADGRGFYVEDTGEGISENERDRVMGHGYTTSRDGTG
ncbi:MAG: histidine kinase N-terminal 7TM domain-containing protein, partial [Halobacteria archaeon]|nr:histidine kinase N-terminal 7TM domain-containing protein [Halobacteria archaeon]